MTGSILSTIHDTVLTLSIDNPAHANAVSDAMAAALIQALAGAADTASLVVLTGTGADFCTGRLGMGQRTGAPAEALARRRATQVIFDCYNAIRQTPVPVIAAVRGRAHGFGCAIAALCDITLAAESASFQIPEMAHNILPTMVMSALVDRLPRKMLSYLVYSHACISAAEALAAGLISKVVPDATLDQAVAALGATMRVAPAPALRGVKEFTRVAYDMPIAGAIAYAENLHATVNSASEMRARSSK